MTAQITGRVLRTSAERISMRWRVRPVLLCVVVLAVTVAICCVELTTGDFPIPFSEVLSTLVGNGSYDDNLIILQLRLPRVVAAILIGFALGISGALFQGVSRNPLGSPDIVGFTSGAAAGAVAEIVLFGGGESAVAVAALAGGLLTSALVYCLSVRGGQATGYRLVLVGIGLSSLLMAFTAYLLTRATLYEAQDAQVWLIGSINGVAWNAVAPLAIVLVVLAPLGILIDRPLGLMAMGDEAAAGLGVRTGWVRLGAVLVATGLAAGATAVAGPISFIALSAPHIARRVTGARGIASLPAGLLGAFLLVASDELSQRIFSGSLPVGVVTAVVGGGYLCYLLAHELKVGRS